MPSHPFTALVQHPSNDILLAREGKGDKDNGKQYSNHSPALNHPMCVYKYDSLREQRTRAATRWEIGRSDYGFGNKKAVAKERLWRKAVMGGRNQAKRERGTSSHLSSQSSVALSQLYYTLALVGVSRRQVTAVSGRLWFWILNRARTRKSRGRRLSEKSGRGRRFQ